MALKRPLVLLLGALAVTSAVVLVSEIREWSARGHYNDAVSAERFAEAADWLGDYGLFAAAYAEHQRGAYQEARALYNLLEGSDDATVRLAALFNSGNTYLEQALGMDLEAEADRALPLLELAKLSYRDVLHEHAAHWDARYNLQRTLLLSPDVPARRMPELEGLRGAVRVINNADPEGDLP